MLPARFAISLCLLCGSAACTTPSNAHPRVRCDNHGVCPDGLTCHAGFCIEPEVGGQSIEDVFGDDGGAHLDAGEAQGSPETNGDADGEPSSSPTPPDPGDGDDGPTNPGSPPGSGDGESRDAGQEPPHTPQVPEPEPEQPAQDAGASEEVPPMSCLLGPCCPLGLTLCGDTCVNVLTALAHCGQCDRECKPGLFCLGGTCCKANEILCGDECVDPMKDKHHCGGCWQECDKGPCKDGLCRRDP